MNDLRFMIVNSNLLHSQNLIHELKNRVSFDVHQDTEEKNIWGLMQGGKDDLYVYDRCGRLAYYIPFPLSIMSSEESSLVTSAILATYYRSPCGTTCEKNSPTLEDYLNNVNLTESTSETTTENISSTTELYRTIFSSNHSEDGSDLLQTNTSSLFFTSEIKGNNSEVIGDMDYPTLNKTEISDNFEYPTYDETLEDDTTNATIPKHDHAFLNTLYRLFFNAAATESRVIESTNETLPSNSTSIGISKSNEIHVPLNFSDADITNSNISITDIPSEIETQTSKQKPDRCAEADPSVCKDWSKKRLLRAHNCCSLIEDESLHQPQYCRNFGKKRCKKMRTILKCCIKTALFEVMTEADVTTQVVEEEEVTTEAVPVTEVKCDIVCCRNVEGGKLCRVSENPTCELGEYKEESGIRNQDVPLLGRTM